VSQQLSKRARQVLYAVVTEFIATGEPVGSRTLSKKYGFDLSPATIRNVLADLEDAEYLTQPHTSAGRVPTVHAFRLFIDALMRMRQLTTGDAARIADWFDEMRPGADIARETGKLLSDLTGAAAIVAKPSVETRTLLRIRFIPTRPGELLSVVVFSDGAVENRYLVTEKPLESSELERIHNLLEETAEGRSLAELREHLMRSLQAGAPDSAELDTLHTLGASLVEAALGATDRRPEVIIEGQARLLERPEFSNTKQARELLRMLEDRERLVGLLDKILTASTVQVFFDSDTSDAGGYPVSVVAAPYHEQHRGAGGVLGIVGPARMDYPTVVPLVEATADAMSAALARSRDPLPKPPRGNTQG
jgi:heat-inducible transcriptional repressor